MNFLKKLHHPFFDHSPVFLEESQDKTIGTRSLISIFLTAEDTSSSSNILSRNMAQC